MKITRRIVLALMALASIAVLAGCTTPGSGEIGVTRNGGPYDNHRIRGCPAKDQIVASGHEDCGIVQTGSSASWQGWGSDTHFYPVDTQQRFFRMCTAGYDGQDNPVKCNGADAPAITVPTADGVDATIEGTFYLNTVFSNDDKGFQALRAFDTQFATRTFDGNHAYEGNTGWEKFLAAIVEPIVVNNLRETVGGVQCADLVSSCALVQNQGQQGQQQVVQKAKGVANQSNVARIQDAVGQGLASDLQDTLGREYFQKIGFRLQRVLLPQRVQDAINEAQSSFAQVSQSQARVRSARLDAQANEERQRGYLKCPTCARIDAIKSLPRNLQALGSGIALGIK